jgi:multiple sugar transport system ATP-binding protein
VSGPGDGDSNPKPAAAESPPTDAGSGGSPEAGSEDRTHVVIEGLEKQYGDVTAVEKLSLSLAKGELLVLVGPSGCGKSTTLRCIAGLEEPSAGDIRIRGESVVGKRPEDRSIAMVFQNYALYPHKTARENIGFGLRMTTDLSKADINDRVESVAEMLGIEDLLEQQPKSLSGGQQQRVALGRAIVRDPAAFLLDEPLSNLDATLRSRMRTEIQELQQDLDATTIYVTHDQTEAMTMGDRIAVLNKGRLEQVGTPMACYHRPATRFVASFIGEPSMNFLEARFDPTTGRFIGDIAYPATDPLAAAAREAEGPAVTFGVRPEDIHIKSSGAAATGTGGEAGATDTGSPPDGAEWERGDIPVYDGRVDVVEPVGERSFLYLTLDAGPNLTAAVGGTAAAREGGQVRAGIPADGIHLFDAATGAALHHPDEEDTTTPDSGPDHPATGPTD